nr:putative reverse transcriptase domain-containing protein [Tanacetum cinerariifolium]
IAPLAVPPILSFRKAPVDKVPVLLVQHQVLNQFEIPLVESEEDPISPQEIPRENLKLWVRPQVASSPTSVPLDGLHFDDKLHLVEEPVEIVDRKVKRLKQSRIPLVKVRWNSKRGPEFTWEREDQFQKKYPHLFARTASSSSVTS